MTAHSLGTWTLRLFYHSVVFIHALLTRFMQCLSHIVMVDINGHTNDLMIEENLGESWSFVRRCPCNSSDVHGVNGHQF